MVQLEVLHMPLNVNELQKEALRLDPRERALLAEHLISSLDAGEDPDADRLWIEEAERRYIKYKQDGVVGKLAEMVLSEAQAKLRGN